MRFADTNILLYAVSPLPEESAKQQVASGVLTQDDLALSVQVLQEFYAQATLTSRPWFLPHEQAVDFIQPLLRFPVEDVTLGLMHDALAIRARFGLNYWDCVILAAARLMGCDAVYSEDLSDTQDYDGLRVINPFSELPQPA